jgi:hypothetical protein
MPTISLLFFIVEFSNGIPGGYLNKFTLLENVRDHQVAVQLRRIEE